MSGTDWGRVLLLVAAVVPAVILHEVSHGFVANLFGDDTAKRAGRLSLNPIKHVDPFGTVLLPLLLSLSGVGAFGYAKPVPVNVGRLRNPRQHSLYVSLAGPITNLSLMLVAVLVLRGVWPDSLQRAVFFGEDSLSLVPRYLFWFGFVNVLLAVFNLLPIPPLDGSALVERVLPTSWWPNWIKLRQYGFAILLLLIFATDWLDRVFDPAIERYLRLLG